MLSDLRKHRSHALATVEPSRMSCGLLADSLRSRTSLTNWCASLRRPRRPC